jgi:ubiquinone/menaquinone biosynthesis C-methylase UbiE
MADPWETAYLAFETSDQEIHKFVKRLMIIGASRWQRDAEIAELFCGRGNGLRALSKLGFTRLSGVDLSLSLVSHYKGPGRVCVSDCRKLPFKDHCKDFVVVQGGLHHLSTLPDDLEQTLSEIYRVLKDNGLFILVEPWLTPFLSFVHVLCRSKIAKRVSRKVDCLATMIMYERKTYDQWLNQPQMISTLLKNYFHIDQCSFRWGKLVFAGRKMRHTLSS